VGQAEQLGGPGRLTPGCGQGRDAFGHAGQHGIGRDRLDARGVVGQQRQRLVVPAA
jgi:hypothetical protein